jgi:hypothetical protein
LALPDLAWKILKIENILTCPCVRKPVTNGENMPAVFARVYVMPERVPT